MLTRKKHKSQKIELSILIESVVNYCSDKEVLSYDVWRLYEINLVEKIWYKIVPLYRPEADQLLKEHLLHRLYCIALEDQGRDVDYYLKETFYGKKKCGEYRFCELFDNVQCERIHTT